MFEPFISKTNNDRHIQKKNTFVDFDLRFVIKKQNSNPKNDKKKYTHFVVKDNLKYYKNYDLGGRR